MATPIIKVSVNEVGTKFENKVKEFATILAEIQLKKLAEASADKMKDIIKESTIRPSATHKLENAIEAEQIDALTYGVGKVSDLNQKAPYWRHINYGSLGIGAKFQHQLPKGTFQPGVAEPVPNLQDGRWVSNKYSTIGGKMYMPIVKKPIQAKNFIEKTLAWALTNFRTIVKG
jgi:hypothetical protein